MSIRKFKNERTPFQAIKNKNFKKSKNSHFSKGVNPWSSPKIVIIPTFLCNISQEKFFYDILKRKKGLSRLKKQDIKKRRKIPIYPKALTHGFGPKKTIFQTFFLGHIGQENVFYDILERKHAFLGYKKKQVQKVEKFTCFQRSEPMVLVQKWQFLQLFLLGNIGRENVFYVILKRKNSFLGYKNKKFKKSTN